MNDLLCVASPDITLHYIMDF